MKFNFCITDTEKLHQSKKYKPPVFIVFVASILILSVLSTSVFATNVYSLDDTYFSYLMNLKNVRYTIYYDGVNLNPLNSYFIQYETINDQQNFLGINGVLGRQTDQYNATQGTYIYIPIMLNNISSLECLFFLGSPWPQCEWNLPAVSLVDFYGNDIVGGTVTIAKPSDPSFQFSKIQAQAINLTDYATNTLTHTGMWLTPYSLSCELPQQYGAQDVGFLRLVISSNTPAYAWTPIFYGVSSLTYSSPDPQLSSMLITLQGNFSSILTTLYNINGNLNLNNQGIQQQLQQIIELDEAQQEQMEDIKDSFDEVNDQLDQISQDLNNISKPPEEDFDFDFSSIIGEADMSVFTESDQPIFNLLNNEYVTPYLTIIFSLAAPGFLLFGKR